MGKTGRCAQQVLNRFETAQGMCYQLHHFGEKTFYFSDNIDALLGRMSTSPTLEQWYQAIYEDDRQRLRRYVKDVFEKSWERYSFNYRLRNRWGQLVWVSSSGTCTFDRSQPGYYLGSMVEINGREGGRQGRPAGGVDADPSGCPRPGDRRAIC